MLAACLRLAVVHSYSECIAQAMRMLDDSQGCKRVLGRT